MVAISTPSAVGDGSKGSRDDSTKLRGVALFGGGTGGHLYPGLALCEYLRCSCPDCRLTLFRTGRVIEETISRTQTLDTVLMDLQPPGPGVRGRWRFLRQVWRQVAEIRRRLSSMPIDAVVGLGGYASVPGILAARLEGIPLVLLEQNARPGKVNRLLGPLAKCVACAEAASFKKFGPLRGLMRLEGTGNPLRASVREAHLWRQAHSATERRREVGAGDRRVVLIMGGSQGAHAINKAIIDALPRLRHYSDRIFFIHISGHADKEYVDESYRQSGWPARVMAFEPELPRLLAAADLVLARAGGTSTAELAAIGVPSYLVPFPGHRDRHQYENANVLVARGSARVLEQANLGDTGIEEMIDCLFDDHELGAMEGAALGSAKVDGAERVADLLLSIVNRVN